MVPRKYLRWETAQTVRGQQLDSKGKQVACAPRSVVGAEELRTDDGAHLDNDVVGDERNCRMGAGSGQPRHEKKEQARERRT